MKKTVNKLLALTLTLCCAAQAETAENPAETVTPESHTVEGVTYPYLRQLTAEEKESTPPLSPSIISRWTARTTTT